MCEEPFSSDVANSTTARRGESVGMGQREGTEAFTLPEPGLITESFPPLSVVAYECVLSHLPFPLLILLASRTITD